MKKIWIIIILFSPFISFANDIFIGEKEHLGAISIGTGSVQILYEATEEGFFSPGPPIIDNNGILWFSPFRVSTFIIFENGHFKSRAYPSYWPHSLNYNNYSSVSQNGVFGFYSGNPYEGVFQWEQTNFNNTHNLNMRITYQLPTGFIVEVSGWNKRTHNKEIFLVSVERIPNKFSMDEDKKGEFIFRDPENTKSWLPTQPGGFSIGDDGLLYRNGVLWSAQEPINGSYAYKYIGRLMSGHQVWVGGGIGEFIRYVTISNSEKQIELILELPWAPQLEPREYGYHPFNYGLGPWGEIYALIAPYLDEKTPWQPKNGDTSELVVVRNHLKYFGRLNDGGVRLRSAPNTSGQILGSYPEKTGFRILERNGKTETIAGMTSDWVKVRLLDGTEGWFFGAFVHNLYDGPNGNPPPWPNVPDW